MTLVKKEATNASKPATKAGPATKSNDKPASRPRSATRVTGVRNRKPRASKGVRIPVVVYSKSSRTSKAAPAARPLRVTSRPTATRPNYLFEEELIDDKFDRIDVFVLIMAAIGVLLIGVVVGYIAGRIFG